MPDMKDDVLSEVRLVGRRCEGGAWRFLLAAACKHAYVLNPAQPESALRMSKRCQISKFPGEGAFKRGGTSGPMSREAMFLHFTLN